MEPSSGTKPSRGLRTFFTIWFGQLVSLLGSQLTGFALGVWVYEQTHSIFMSAGIVAPLLAAPLADYVFKPAMSPGGALAKVLGPVIGVGSKHGSGVLISLAGVIIMVVVLVAWNTPLLRKVETELPDHQAGADTTAAV